MKKLYKFLILPLLTVICSYSGMYAGHQSPESFTEMIETVQVPDTIVHTDTIVVKEVITRTDVIHRTETILRYEDPLKSDSIYYNYKGTNLSFDSRELPQPKSGGNFIWVPDSLKQKVEDLVNGKYSSPAVIIANSDLPVDLNEKVIFRGDTLPMVLKDRNLGRYNRGLFNYLFIPKGIWQLGLTASYGEFSTENLEILDLVSDIDFYGHIFAIHPYFSYFLKNNVSIGMKLGYTSGQAEVGSFNVDIDEDMSFNLHDIMYKSKIYSAALTFSQYLGIARRGRFGVFNEVELAFSSGTSDFHRPFNGQMRKTHTTTNQVGLNFSPGLCVYVVDKLSFNVSFGVFGLYVKNEKQRVDGENLGSRTTSGANFRFNIFNINFGIAINI